MPRGCRHVPHLTDCHCYTPDEKCDSRINYSLSHATHDRPPPLPAVAAAARRSRRASSTRRLAARRSACAGSITSASTSPTSRDRSRFYQRLFGLPSRRVSATSVQLQIGSGPQHLALSAAASGAAPKIDHFCLGVDAFNASIRVTKALAGHGVAKSDTPGPLTLRIIAGAAVRAVDAHGRSGRHRRATAGRGVLRRIRTARLRVHAGRAVTVHRTDRVEGLQPHDGVLQRRREDERVLQGRLRHGHPVVSGTDGTDARGRQRRRVPDVHRRRRRPRAGTPPRPASINHFCMALENFKPDEILKTLETVGIKPRESQTGPVGPLRHYISLRMENRGRRERGDARALLHRPRRPARPVAGREATAAGPGTSATCVRLRRLRLDEVDRCLTPPRFGDQPFEILDADLVEPH